MIVQPFPGLRPRKDLSSRIPSYPYDVVDADEARKLTSGDPYSFLHVVRSEVDLPPEIDPHDERVYAKARENLQSMVEKGWLERDPGDAYYVYRLTRGEHVQSGLVGVAAVSDYEAGKIRRHEHTRPEKESDRVRHTEAISAHPGPVFLAYRDEESPRLGELIAESMAIEPDVDFLAADGIDHALWVVRDPARIAAIEAAFRELPNTYIADGHHRAAAYARVAKDRGGEASRFLAAHFPASQLRILDYNRVVRDLNGLSPSTLPARIRRAGFFIQEGHQAKSAPRPRTFGMYLNDHWYLLLARPEALESDPVRGLDVSILTERLLQGVLGIGDPRTDPRIDFVGGIRGMGALERLVDSGKHAVAFSLYPTSLADVMAVADAGLVMPPKSTWFEPKLRSGMVVHTI